MDLTIVLLVLEEAWVHISLCANVNTQYFLLCVPAPILSCMCVQMFLHRCISKHPHTKDCICIRERRIFLKEVKIGMVKFT